MVLIDYHRGEVFYTLGKYQSMAAVFERVGEARLLGDSSRGGNKSSHFLDDMGIKTMH
jgi:hypothetical protein